MAIEVMNRVEQKYMVNTYTYLQLLKTLEQYTQPDAYHKNHPYYTICNLYYDTEDNYLIRTSLEKPKYKEKLRLRSYGVPTDLDQVYLEIKKKYNGIVNKRRVGFSLTDAYEFTETHHIVSKEEDRSGQIMNELAFALKTYDPKPKVYIAYDRRAYLGENGFRITFDHNIRARRDHLLLEDGDQGTPLLDPNLWLIETKTEGALPLWLAKLFSENRVFPTSFSKYGTEYLQFLRQGGTKSCLNPSSIQQPIQQRQSPSHGRVFAPQLV